MVGKCIFLFLLFAVMLGCDRSRWKRTSVRGRILYGVLLLPSMYLGILFAADLQWPNLNDLISYFLGEPAKRIVESVKLPPP